MIKVTRRDYSFITPMYDHIFNIPLAHAHVDFTGIDVNEKNAFLSDKKNSFSLKKRKINLEIMDGCDF